MPILAEVLGANEEYAATFGQERADASARPGLRDPHLHGRATGSRQVRRVERGRRARHSQRRRPSQRRRHPIARDLLQAARYPRVVRHSLLQRGMEFFTDEVMRDLLAQSLETAKLGPAGFLDVGSWPGSTEAKYVDSLTISNREQSVIEDVRRIRGHPLIPARTPIYGYTYDVRTGQLIEVSEATEAGRPS
jgi:carbonic anhydrase